MKLCARSVTARAIACLVLACLLLPTGYGKITPPATPPKPSADKFRGEIFLLEKDKLEAVINTELG
jgi:hypothetical protein